MQAEPTIAFVGRASSRRLRVRSHPWIWAGAVVLAGIMVVSPLGNSVFQDLGLPSPDSAIVALGAAFAAMFPGASDLGPLAPSASVSVSVDFPLQNSALLTQTIQAISTPGSQSYRHFLTPSQFDAEYAPSPAEYQQAVRYFSAYGLQLTTSSDRLTLGVAGGPSAMGTAFHTSFDDYRVADSIDYGPTSTPTLPSGLGVTAAFGFTSATFMQPTTSTANLVPVTSGAVVTPLATDDCVAGKGTDTDGYTPCQIQGVYGTNTLLNESYTGSGEQVAIVDAYDPTETETDLGNDLTSFSTDYGLPTPNVHYVYPVALASTCNSTAKTGACYDNTGWGGETVLDMDWVHATGIDATEDVTLAPNSGAGLYEDINGLVSQDLPNVITLSWGEPDVNVWTKGTTGETFLCTIECNASTDGSYATLHPILEAAAAEGITVLAASGDCGADDGTPEPATNYPASDEYVTGVGGTTLTATGMHYTSETAWAGNESSCADNDGGAGGGWAPTPQPWYQTGTGIVNKGLRGVPDVGITVGSWLDIVQAGKVTVSAGTSDGGPQWAGLLAIADQIHGGDLGFINPVIYEMLRSSSYSTYFHDITSGSNGYSAGTGWDPVTGVGTPEVQNAIPFIAGNTPTWSEPTLSATLSASATSGTAPLTVTFTATATGGTGTYKYYDFSETGTLDGNATPTSHDTATYVYKVAGAYQAQVIVYDSAGNSTASNIVLINVGNAPGSFAVTLASSSTTPNIGQAVTLTATPTGGTSPYDYAFFPGDGTYLNGTTSDTQVHTFGAAGTYCAVADAFDDSHPTNGAQSNVVTINVGGASGSCGLAAGAIALNRSASGEVAYAVTFTGSFTGSTGTLSGTWIWGDASHTTFSGLTSSPATGSHTYTTPGTYTVTLYVDDPSGSTTNVSETTTVTVYAHVSAGFSPSSWHPGAPANETFTAAVAGGDGADTLSWQFGDGSTSGSSAALTASQTYYKANTYTVNLTVTDSLSYRALVSITFTVFGAATAPLPLVAGWNLVALPLIDNDYTAYTLSVAVGPAFEEIQDGHGGAITQYDRTKAQDALNGSAAIVGGDGIWIEVSAPGTLNIVGNTTASLTAPVGAGWSLLGWSVTGTSTTASAMATSLGDVEALSEWNAASQSFVTFVVGWDSSTGPYNFSIGVGQAVYIWTLTSGSCLE